MNQRGPEADAEFAAAHIKTDAVDSEPFDTFTGPPAGAAPVEPGSGRFDEGPATGTVNPVRPGSRRAQRLAETGVIDQLSPFEAAAFKVRDFRPTETTALPADAAAAVPAPAPVAPPTSETGRPLTRRELRALEAARAAEAATVEHAPVAPDAVDTPDAAIAPDAAVDSQAGVDTPAAASEAPVPEAQATVSAPSYELREPFEGEQPSWQAPADPPALVEPPRAGGSAPEYIPSSLDLPGVPFAVPAPPVEQPTQPEQPTQASQVEQPSQAEPTEHPTPPPAGPLFDLAPPTGTPLGTSQSESPTLADLPAPPSTDPVFVPNFSLAQYPAPTMLPTPIDTSRGVDAAQLGQTAPVGHWSANDGADHTGVIDVDPDTSGSSGPITSSALVLPAIPEGADLSVPFSTATGEVLITGTINLPSTLGTTGAHPNRYDHSDLDAIIDAADRDDIEGDSAPVRAIRAVSTHTSPRDVISISRNTSGNRLPVVLAITAGAMMVSVTVLVVVGFAFGTF